MGIPGTVTSHGPGHLYQHPEAVLSTEVAPVSGVAWHFWIFLELSILGWPALLLKMVLFRSKILTGEVWSVMMVKDHRNEFLKTTAQQLTVLAAKPDDLV